MVGAVLHFSLGGGDAIMKGWASGGGGRGLIGSNYENEQQEKGEKGVRVTRSVTYPSFPITNGAVGILKFEISVLKTTGIIGSEGKNIFYPSPNAGA